MLKRNSFARQVVCLCALGLLAPEWLAAGEPPPVVIPTTPTTPGAPGTTPAPPSPDTPATDQSPTEVLVEAPEPRYVAPTLRDKIGRIWAPVLINGKGPFRLVLDTGASHSAIIASVATALGDTAQPGEPILVHGVTGSALVSTVNVASMEVGELLIAPTKLPIVADVFGGAEGVLGREGLPDKRILADFVHDRLTISRSHRERAGPGFATIPLKLVRGGLLSADVQIGSVKAQAIIDTGGQATIGNLALRRALAARPQRNVRPDEIVGVTLDLQKGDAVTSPPIDIGRLQISQVRITYADTFLFEHLKLTREPTLLLGMDVLGTFDVLVIDYRIREMQIRMRGR